MRCDRAVAVTFLMWLTLFIILTAKPSVTGASIESERTSQKVVTVSSIKITPQRRSLGMFTLTAYCSCEKCCGKWALSRPKDSNGNPIVYTASGRRAEDKRTIAVDRSVLPLGTEVVIDGHSYRADDTGGAVKGRRIDVYFASHEDAVSFGKRNREVFIK